MTAYSFFLTSSQMWARHPSPCAMCMVASTIQRLRPLGPPFFKSECACLFDKPLGPIGCLMFLYLNRTVDGNKMTLQIWDTAGQERFRSMVSLLQRSSFSTVTVFLLVTAGTDVLQKREGGGPRVRPEQGNLYHIPLLKCLAVSNLITSEDLVY